MSDTPTSEAPKKKGGKKKILLLGTAALVIGGGGTAGGLYATGHMPFAQGVQDDPDQPHLVPREGVSSGEVAVAKAAARAPNARPNPRVFQATYVPLEGNFTSNVGGGTAFVQVGLGLSTYHDERVVERVRTHEMALRSAILMALSEADPNAIATMEGKQQLKARLRDAVNSVLTIKEGFGGIDEVHFTSFVTQ